MVEHAGKDRHAGAVVGPGEGLRAAPGKQTEVERTYGAAHGAATGAPARDSAAAEAALPPASSVQRLFGRAGGGAPLPAPLAAQMGAAFSTSFADVRVHEDASAGQLGAAAYARGNDLHFAPGKYDPDSEAGRELIGHELTHVVQQRAGRVRVQGKGMALNADPALEAEADALGARAARGEHVATASAPPTAPTAAAPLQLKLSDARVLLHQFIASPEDNADAAEHLRALAAKLKPPELNELQDYARTLPGGPVLFAKITGIRDPGRPEQVTQPSNPQRSTFDRQADVSEDLKSDDAWTVDWVIDSLVYQIGRVNTLPPPVTDKLIDWLTKAPPDQFDRVVLAASQKMDLDYFWQALAGDQGPVLGHKLLSSKGTKGGTPPSKSQRAQLREKVQQTDNVEVLKGLFAQRFLVPSITGSWDAPRLKKLYATLDPLPDHHTIGNLALLEVRGKDGTSRGEYARQGIEIQHPPDKLDEIDHRNGQRDGGPTSNVAKNWGAEPIAFEGKDRFNEVVRHEVGHAVDAGDVYSSKYCTTLAGGHWKFHNDETELGRAAFGFSGGGFARDLAFRDDAVMSGLGSALRGARGSGDFERFQYPLTNYVKRIYPAPQPQPQPQPPPSSSGGLFSGLMSMFSSESDKAPPPQPPRPKPPGLSEQQRQELTRLTVLVGDDPAAKLLTRHMAGEVNPGEAAVVNGRAFVDLSNLGHGLGRTASYDFSARQRQVSDYQFVSPSEWFAEAYAAYYEPVDGQDELPGARLRERDPATWRFFSSVVHTK
jgi:hypothetical protein